MINRENLRKKCIKVKKNMLTLNFILNKIIYYFYFTFFKLFTLTYKLFLSDFFSLILFSFFFLFLLVYIFSKYVLPLNTLNQVIRIYITKLSNNK